MQQNKIILADCSANLLSDNLAGFISVPLKVIAGEKEFVDNEALDVSEMLVCLNEHKGPSSTACPSVGEWLQAFGEAKEVYGVCLTSKLSGCYNAACVAKEQYLAKHPERKVFILDSLSTGPEMELIVEKYYELIEFGYSFKQVQEKIKEYLETTHLLFSLESLSNFVKNGRVSPTLAKAVSLLGIRIVGRASSEGDLEPLHKCRGEKRSIAQLWNSMQENGYSGGKVRIRHSDNQKAAQKLSENILGKYPDADIKIGPNRGLCSYYAEKGGVLVGFESVSFALHSVHELTYAGTD